MYSDKTNVQILLALLKAHGIRHVVLCPGSRNVPIVYSMAGDSDFCTYQMTDERSAAFYALGLILSHQQPVAVCCTSGSALLNMHPAVSEAYYRKLPLLVISADRPRQWIGQMDGQTVPQPGALGSLVRFCADLPEVKDAQDHLYCNRLVNEALLKLTFTPSGPVHINIPLDEPLFAFNTPVLPTERVIRMHQALDLSLCHMLAQAERVLLVVGQCEYAQHEPKAADALAVYPWPLLTEHLSNLSVQAVRAFDRVLYAVDKTYREQLVPDVLITMGGHIISKRLKELLRANPPRHHIHISPHGACIDLYGALTDVVALAPEAFAAQCKAQLVPMQLNPEQRHYAARWMALAQSLATPQFPFSEMSAIGALMKQLPHDAVLHIANSSVIRYAELFDVPSGVVVHANRGVNGIEGSLSVAVGAAAHSAQCHFLAIGDLSFFYDMNALWAETLGANLRILLLNNGGGEIFNALPGLDTSGRAGHFIMGRHAAHAAGWAQSRGCDYYAVRKAADLAPAIAQLVDPLAQKPVLVEVFTDKDQDVALLKDYYHQLKHK